MNAEAANAVSVLVGVTSLKLALTDDHLRYVKASLQPWLVVAGAILLLLGLVGLLRTERERRAPAATSDPQAHPHVDPHDHDHEPATQAGAVADEGSAHGHSHESGPRVAWLLVLPVLTIFLVAPAPLGSYAAGRGSVRLTAPKSSFPQMRAPVRGANEMTLREFTLRSYFDDGRSLDGATVRLVGFVTPEKGVQTVFLTRFVLSCCAADGRPIKVRLLGLKGVAPSADEWLEVEGRWVEPTKNAKGEALTGRPAELTVTSFRRTTAPAQPYES